MPPHNASEEVGIMMNEAETTPSSEDKVAAPVATNEEGDDNQGLGEVALTPTSTVASSKNDSDAKEETETASMDEDNAETAATFDALVKMDDNNAAKNSDGEDGAPAQRNFGERWGSLRTRMQTKWQSNKAALADEQAVPAKRADSTSSEGKEVEGTPASRFPRPLFKKKAGGAAPAAAATVVDPSKLSADDMATFRASRISVTVQKESRDTKWGFGMDKHRSKPKNVRIGVMAGMGLLEHAPFQVGDTLVSINNQACINAEATIQELVEMEARTPVTLMVETPEGNPNLVQAMVRKPSADANLGIGFYIPLDALEAELKKEEEEKNKETAVATSVATPEAATEESSKTTPEATKAEERKKKAAEEAAAKVAAIRNDPTNKLLHIHRLDANGLLSHSALSQGDIVVAINATPCSQLTPAQAEELLRQSDDSVTIIAMKPPAEPTSRMQRWLRNAKRVGIAIGGGTMVGVGLIFIPTLPPPFGEVLIVGGVSVLGTEFEAPKRVMKSARDSFERAVGREEPKEGEQAKTKEGDKDATTEGDATETATTTTDGEEVDAAAATTAPPKKTMGTRFKNFGRRHVLPFLDQVVGDRKDLDENTSPAEGEAATIESESSVGSDTPNEDQITTSPIKESLSTEVETAAVVSPSP